MVSALVLLTACVDTNLAPEVGRDDAGLHSACAAGSHCDPLPIGALPFTALGDTRSPADDHVDAYSCAPGTDESGGEVWYLVELAEPGVLTASIDEVTGDGVDVDVHLLSDVDGEACLARGHATASASVPAGPVWIVVDTWVSGSGVAQDGPYQLDVEFAPLPSADCSMVATDVALRSGGVVVTPAIGPVVKEAHLVTEEDGLSGWPSSSRDRLDAHYALTDAVTGIVMDRTEAWAPAGEGGSLWGQGSTGIKVPAEAEAWYITMNWVDRPAPGTPMIVRNPATGATVVAAAGYETGPGSTAAIAGVVEEVHLWLGTDHLDDLEIGFAADPSLAYGPVVCAGGGGTVEEEEELVLEACYPSACLPVEIGISPGSDYTYPSPLSTQYEPPVRWLDLDTLDPDTQLAPNFVLDELAQDWKGRYGVLQVHAVERLQALRDEVGPIVVNSGYRPPAYNDDVGGATWSRHMYGDAFDMAPSYVSLNTLADACYDEGASYVGYYTSHIHCDWRNDPLDPVFFDAFRALSWVGELPDLDATIAWDRDALVAPAEGWDEGEPLREWAAYDARGEVLATAATTRWTPPVDAVRVDVLVGREILRTVSLD